MTSNNHHNTQTPLDGRDLPLPPHSVAPNDPTFSPELAHQHEQRLAPPQTQSLPIATGAPVMYAVPVAPPIAPAPPAMSASLAPPSLSGWGWAHYVLPTEFGTREQPGAAPLWPTGPPPTPGQEDELYLCYSPASGETPHDGTVPRPKTTPRRHPATAQENAMLRQGYEAYMRPPRPVRMRVLAGLLGWPLPSVQAWYMRDMMQRARVSVEQQQSIRASLGTATDVNAPGRCETATA